RPRHFPPPGNADEFSGTRHARNLRALSLPRFALRCAENVCWVCNQAGTDAVPFQETARLCATVTVRRHSRTRLRTSWTGCLRSNNASLIAECQDDHVYRVSPSSAPRRTAGAFGIGARPALDDQPLDPSDLAAARAPMTL